MRIEKSLQIKGVPSGKQGGCPLGVCREITTWHPTVKIPVFLWLGAEVDQYY